jgi:hypothetical protein
MRLIFLFLNPSEKSGWIWCRAAFQCAQKYSPPPMGIQLFKNVRGSIFYSIAVGLENLSNVNIDALLSLWHI